MQHPSWVILYLQHRQIQILPDKACWFKSLVNYSLKLILFYSTFLKVIVYHLIHIRLRKRIKKNQDLYAIQDPLRLQFRTESTLVTFLAIIILQFCFFPWISLIGGFYLHPSRFFYRKEQAIIGENFNLKHIESATLRRLCMQWRGMGSFAKKNKLKFFKSTKLLKPKMSW